MTGLRAPGRDVRVKVAFHADRQIEKFGTGILPGGATNAGSLRLTADAPDCRSRGSFHSSSFTADAEPARVAPEPRGTVAAVATLAHLADGVL